MTRTGKISENSRRVARNTVLLYFRMLLLMFIGLFTSRVVLQTLGVDDFGTYNAVAEAVTVFTFLTASVSAAISRYMAFSLGKGDERKSLHAIFSTGVLIQFAFSLVLVALVETAGRWFLNSRMNIPAESMEAARWVLQCSMGIMVINMLSVPYNAAIIAHEKMGAFAAISIVEAVLKLSVALLLYISPYDKLITYSVLMLAVAFAVRLSYGVYCRLNFFETSGLPVFDTSLLGAMFGFAGWNFFGSSAFVLNRQGVSSVVNIFFGVAVNAARGIASQVENIVKQFVSNFLTALNPQITKSYSSGDFGYCFELVRKGAKFSYLVSLVFFIPVLFEAEYLLGLWLGSVPESAAAFSRLALLAMMVDMTGNSLLTLQLATGKVKRYYIITGTTSYMVLPLVYIAFRLGLGALWAYVVFAAVYAVVFVQKLLIVRSATGFPLRPFLSLLLKLLAATAVSMSAPLILRFIMPDNFVRLLAVCVCGWGLLGLSTCAFLLTPGETGWLLRKAGRFLPDRIYLRLRYFSVFSRRLHLRKPVCYTEHIQHLKIYDRNPLYKTLVDKADVKDFVVSRIGSDAVVPTLGVWERAGDIDFGALPDKFVLKCTHDSGSAIICTDKNSFDSDEARRRLDAALGRNFFRLDREWVYKGLKPRILAEEYLGQVPLDYKFFCFDGKPEFMFIATGRYGSGETCFDFFDMDFNWLDVRNGHPNAAVRPSKPQSWDRMKALAAELSRGIPMVRVDFYDIDGRVLFGEYTFCHWGGFVPFDPDVFDFRAGSFASKWKK